MPVVDASVGGAGEADHPIPDGRAEAVGQGAAAVSVDEGSSPAPSTGPAGPPKLADGETDEAGGLGHHQCTALEGVEDDEALLRTLRQRDHASPVRLAGGGHFTEILVRT